jgi:hypothetical protein
LNGETEKKLDNYTMTSTLPFEKQRNIFSPTVTVLGKKVGQLDTAKLPVNENIKKLVKSGKNMI